MDIEIVPARDVRSPGTEAAQGMEQAIAYAGGLEPERLVHVEAAQPLGDFREQFEVAPKAFQEVSGYVPNARGGGHPLDELIDHLDRNPDAVLMLQTEHCHRGFGRHVRISITITADPAAEGQRCDVPGEFTQVFYGVLEVFQYGWERLPGDLFEVEECIAGLVDDFGAFSPQFVGLPQQLHGLGELTTGPGCVRGIEQVSHP
jgi:hypothetical protein